MSEVDDLRRALRHEQPMSRRQKRAARTRAQVFSPLRIVTSLLSLPFLALGVAVSLYVRTSPYDPPDAFAHLVARASCDAARTVGLAPSYRGALGYHARNDADGNGVACERVFRFEPSPEQSAVAVQSAASKQSVEIATPKQAQRSQDRMKGGAKFLKP